MPTTKLLIESAQQMADRLYSSRKIKALSGAAELTAEDIAYAFPKLDNDTIHDIAYKATIHFHEKETN